MADATPLYRVRLAIRDELSDLAAGDKVLVAVSGGADSMALAAGLLQEAATLTIKPIAIVIDHDLQKESAVVAEHTKAKLIALGYQQVEIRKIKVEKRDGLEASARRARYEALEKFAEEVGANAIFLGHTKDDQAETVLLGLARGSGTRSLSGMAKRIEKYRRPLLAISRADTEAACKELNIEVSAEMFATFTGNSTKNVFQKLYENAINEKYGKMGKAMSERYEKLQKEGMKRLLGK